jgi:lipid-A-disaccharide synthase
VARTVLVSAGEASGDLYASLLVAELRRLWPDAEFFGCAGPRMRAVGVHAVVDMASLAVVGIVEVARHIPRIYKEYRKLLEAARTRRPGLAILTDAPDFHLRVARRLKRDGIPVVYLVAPQVWAWRKGRLPVMRRTIERLLAIFPFEEEFFCSHGVNTTYIGHPLANIVRPALTRAEFFRKHRLSAQRPLITVLPGSRRGEAARHLPPLLDAVDRLYQQQAASFLLPASVTTGADFFRERIGRAPVEVIEGETWDAIAHADLVLAASGTVTVEAALLGTPMVTFYKVAPASWLVGRLLVDVPFYTMVNLIAGRAVVTELMQGQMTGERLAAEASRLLRDEEARRRMRQDLAEVARKLSADGEAMKKACAVIQDLMEGQAAHVS